MARATARTSGGRRAGASRARAAGTRRCAPALRRPRTCRALLPAQPRALHRERRRVQTANLRFRVAANMVNRGDTAPPGRCSRNLSVYSGSSAFRAARPRCSDTSSDKAYEDGDLALAIELSLESAAIADDLGWAWWEAGQLCGAAKFERERGGLDAAEGHAFRTLELSLGLGDRRRLVFAAAELAILAAERGDAERAGRLWGAVEGELTSGPQSASGRATMRSSKASSCAQTALRSETRGGGQPDVGGRSCRLVPAG